MYLTKYSLNTKDDVKPHHHQRNKLVHRNVSWLQDIYNLYPAMHHTSNGQKVVVKFIKTFMKEYRMYRPTSSGKWLATLW